MQSIANITLNPLFPAAAILGLGALAAILALAAYIRSRARARVPWRFALLTVRCVAIAGLVLVLLRPMRAVPNLHEGERPLFAVAIDRSASMKTEDVDGASRDAAVRRAIERSRAMFDREMAGRYDMRYFTFSTATEPGALDQIIAGDESSGMSTDLASALLQATSVPTNRTLAGLLLISDGRDNMGNDARRAATIVKGANAGVWTVPVGSEVESRDVYATARLKQNFLFVKQPGAVTVTLAQSGFTNQYVDVALFREGKPAGTERAVLTDRGATVDFPISEDIKGVYRYSVAVTALEGEADINNNKRTVFVRAVDERTKVLLVEAKPYWDTKFLLRALHRDPNIEVTSIVQVKEEKVVAIAERSANDSPDKKETSQAVSLPKTKDDLFKFDCIILGKGVDALLTAEQLALVRDFVRERGGGAIFARGRSYGDDNEALAALEPLVWEGDSVHGERFELTQQGKDNPVFAFGKSIPADTVIRELPEMVSLTKVEQEKSLSVILARTKQEGEGIKMATIAYQRYGKGKALSIGATGLWRWAITPPELAAYDDVYDRFWGQLVRWLVSDSDFLPGQEISFRTDRYTYDVGETVQLIVRTKFMDAKSIAPAAVVTSPSGKEVTVPLEADAQTPGTYSGRYLPDEQGEFAAALHYTAANLDAPTKETAAFTVYSDSVETRFVSADRALMQDIARTTGGETLTLDQLDTLPEKVRAFELQAKPGTRFADVWDSLDVFAALLGLLAVEWFVRRRLGLV